MDAQLYEAAWTVAAHFIGYAARSRAEVIKRLEKSAFPADVIESVVVELEARGWLDDTQFAQKWVEDRADRKKYGKSRLAAELRRKGVDKEAVEEALESLDAEGEKARALALARARWHPDALAEADRETLLAEKRKLTNFLQRRGFSWEIITEVFTELTANST